MLETQKRERSEEEGEIERSSERKSGMFALLMQGIVSLFKRVQSPLREYIILVFSLSKTFTPFTRKKGGRIWPRKVHANASRSVSSYIQ